ncbi:MAG: flagellar basal-body rod protein FlgF [Halobacteriovoraceae bacterium]|nr:flagellar basal-body rod protein FlgF [Halobacteriovoraceae bacterium]
MGIGKTGSFFPKKSGGLLKNIWVPVSGQIAQQRKVETIANNIANANTAGFKRDEITFKEHLTAYSQTPDNIDLPRKEWNPDDFYRTQGAENAFVKVDGTYTDFQQGALSPTGNKLDIALFGKGLFEVLTPNGVRYTRKGTFGLNKEGEIVNENGYKLLSKLQPGQNLEAGTINSRVIKIPNQGQISISKEGRVFSPEGELATISVVEFKDHHALRKEGSSLFINNADDNTKRENIATTVNQGYVEGSNVNAIREMSELIKAHRQFEAIQKAVKTYDSISGKIANDIANLK